MRAPLATVLLLAACSSRSSSPPPAAEKKAAPGFSWPAPDGWRAETIPFPLEFAPDIARRGVEELRFAPGFFKPEAPGYWTYAFAWVVTDDRPADPATLARELTAYFRGLTRAVAADKKELPPLDLARVEVQLAADGRGTARTFDAFGDGRPVELDVTVSVEPCGSGRAILVAAAPRQAPPVRPGPAEVLRAFRCDPPVLK